MSIKSWFTIRKPEQRSTDQEQTETKANVPKPKPVVRSAFQPARRPRNGLPSTTSIRTSLEIRRRESVVPAKRAAEVDEPADDVARKLPRLESSSPVISNNTHEDNGNGHEKSEAAETLPKRLRADPVVDDESPTKKRKTAFAKGSESNECSPRTEVLSSIEHGSTDGVGIEDTLFAELKEADDPSLCARGAEVSKASSLPRDRLERLSRLKPPKAMRNQLQSYLKSRKASQKSAIGSKDNMTGMGSWTGSEVIPGARKAPESDANSIELPRKGSRRSKSSKTPDSFEVGADLDTGTKSRGKAKIADVPEQGQMRLHRPWRLYDDESLESVG